MTEQDLARVESHPLTETAELPQHATGPSAATLPEKDDEPIAINELEMMQRIANILGNAGYVVLPDCPRCFGEGCENCDYRGRRVFRARASSAL